MTKIEFDIFSTQIRKYTLKTMEKLLGGHIGGSMSIAEVMSVLYGEAMNVDPKNPKKEDRDWLIVSKGHCGPAVYATLALKGFFDIDLLTTMNQGGTSLPSHCDRNKTPGIDMSTGSLGQGMSTGIGVAMGHKLQNNKNYTYVILGDGECDEGQIWEGALFASTKKLSNLVVFIDNNQKQLDGYTKDICDLGDLREKFECFGWFSQSVDGHSEEEILEAIEKAKAQNEKPSMIILNTTKGKDCVFAENELYNHFVRFSKEQYDQGMKFLDEKLEALSKEGK